MKAVAELWTGYADVIATGLRDLVVTDAAGAAVPVQDAFARWVAMTHDVQSVTRSCSSSAMAGAPRWRVTW